MHSYHPTVRVRVFSEKLHIKSEIYDATNSLTGLDFKVALINTDYLGIRRENVSLELDFAKCLIEHKHSEHGLQIPVYAILTCFRNHVGVKTSLLGVVECSKELLCLIA